MHNTVFGEGQPFGAVLARVVGAAMVRIGVLFVAGLS
jgi:hypothetical protein